MTTIPATDLEVLIAKVKAAQKQFATFTQEQVDLIFRKAAFAAAGARIPLAKLAVQETRMGLMEDKVVKNHFASEYIYNKYKDERTCGILEEDKEYGTLTIAEPVGLICAIVPTTNPTSTAIFKALISLKTRNGIIFCPHPRARKATCEAARLVHEAAIAAGAPEGIIAWVEDSSMEVSNALMHHPDINLILATGGPGMVKATSLLTQSIGEDFYKQLCAEEG
jgi:acetaldehyde dehydrogenase/alcohol dehydrogenase